ncbi:FecR family protein [Parapedobacter tibetensis]|uniref:FecR family protein n=1 Tax=Parapedobacter tibetensis TaxID=2972951 RepID=UPI00214D6561|nr:FecR family protein [Parapedobacter tibetensis]
MALENRMDNAFKIVQLLRKHMQGTLTDDEREVLEYWRKRNVRNEALFALIVDENNLAEAIAELHDTDTEGALKEFKRRLEIDGKTARTARPLRWVSVAAAILAILGVGIGIYRYTSNDTAQPSLTSQYGDDALPGSNRATLRLADGRVLELDSTRSGLLAQQQGVYIIKDDDDMVTYEVQAGDNIQGTAAFNTIATPNGGQYRVKLPDGSKVWLNAASSLRYPTRFAGGERRVELDGEGFFEVSPNATVPFIVESRGQSVQVLGTAFNVNAYENEPAKVTTLVKGSISIMPKSGSAKTIRPGQQSVLTGQSMRIEDVDTTHYAAWKNGYFLFNDVELKDVLRQVERWYDVEVDYATVPAGGLYARIDRNKNLSAVLYMIESTSGLKFKLKEGRLSILE